MSRTGVRGVRLPRGLHHHHHHDQHLPRGLERWRFVRGRGRQRARAPSVGQQGRHLGGDDDDGDDDDDDDDDEDDDDDDDYAHKGSTWFGGTPPGGPATMARIRRWADWVE